MHLTTIWFFAGNLVLKRRSDANTCKKCLPDGVNEDSDYLFRGGQERKRESREMEKMENQFKQNKTQTVCKKGSQLS